MTTLRLLARVAGAFSVCLLPLVAIAALIAVADCRRVGASPKSVPPTPPGACLTMSVGNHTCSATVVASTGAGSLILCNNHCFAEQPRPWAPFPRANYPIRCKVTVLATGEAYDATAIDGSPDPDVSVLVTDWRCPDPVPLGVDAKRGQIVEHYGIASRYTQGRCLWSECHPAASANSSFGSELSSIPGDSGAGILSGGYYVGINWGFYTANRVQGGISVCRVRGFLHRSDALGRDYPFLRDAAGAGENVLPLPQTPIPDPPRNLIPQCPPGGCPVPPRPRYPLLRRIFR